MKIQPIGALLAVAVALAPAVARAQQSTVNADGTEELVVDLDDNASDAQLLAVRRVLGGAELTPNSVFEPADHIRRVTVPASSANAIAARLNAMPGVTAAEPNVRMHADFTPNDPQLADQWHMARVHAPAAWNTTCGRGAVVAVVDTGVACENHGEFTRVMDLNATRCTPGYDFVGDDEHANDDQGHGTHVAGTIAQSTNNGFGVAGLAYCATIMPVKVLDRDGYGSLADVAEGIRFAADHGAQVINLSLGGGGRSRVLAEAVQYARRKGAVVVCAAGNNGRFVESPANEPGAFAVSAVGAGDEIAWFSSRGPEVAIAAPGVNVLQHTICDHGLHRCEQFAAWSGTSMAAPHVAGVAALVVSLGVTEPAAVERVLRATASAPEHGARDRELYGAGVVDAAAAVQFVSDRNALFRGLALLIAAAAVLVRIRARKGAVANPLAWAPAALFTSVGLFFLPRLLPHVTPGVDLAMRPLGDWSMLLGAGVHAWLPFANAGLVLGLVALGFGRKAARAPIGGVALGTAAYLAATLATGFHAGPFGTIVQWLWLAVNAFVCLWVARIGLDAKTAE